MSKESIHFTKEEILAVMPQQPPFLFIDEAVYEDGVIKGTYKIKPDEVFFEGHFKDNPVFPGTLMLEALGQLCVLGLVKGVFEGMPKPADPKTIYFLSSESSRCSKISRPNDILEFVATPVRIRRPLASFNVSMTTNSQRSASGEKITLTFDFINE